MSVIHNPYALKQSFFFFFFLKALFSGWKREREKKKGCSFDQSRLADECAQLNVANSQVREINESEFSQLEKGGKEIYDVAPWGPELLHHQIYDKP